NLQTSFLTPPFGFALFYLRGVAEKLVRTIDIYRGALPFVGLQLAGLAMVWFLPGLATELPARLFTDELPAIEAPQESAPSGHPAGSPVGDEFRDLFGPPGREGGERPWMDDFRDLLPGEG
ncbi:MAG: TRAP transporter large permease subunit, partial [Gammaproteobacteria bacterium]